jgi:sulfate/thiosulfate-binding protein
MNSSERGTQTRSRKIAARLGIAGVALAATLGVAACGGSSGSTIALVAYSTPQTAYEKGIEPAFKATPDGKDASFSNSFGSSGDQSRAVESGQPADVVAFSLEPDITRLVDAGKVPASWNQDQYKGIVTDSVVVLMVRPGNPKNIKSFADLTRSDVDVIDPNPATSGGARWNIMAIYGSQINAGKTPAQALDFVKQVIGNTSVQDNSARDSLTTFQGGKGDVLVGYENEAIAAKANGVSLDYVIPDSTIKIENPIAATTSASDAAKKFVTYTRSDAAQQIYADNGYRPVVPSVFAKNKDKFPIPSGLFTINQFGGWSKVSDQFFGDPNGSVIKIESELGNPTSS